MPRIGLARRNKRRQQIVKAAWRCARRMGFRDMTVDDVCAEAKLSKGAFYGYFKQKRDLLIALFEDDAEALDELMDALEADRQGHRDRLRRFTQSMLARSSDPAQVQVRADMWTAMLTEDDVRAAFAARMQRRRRRLRSWVEKAVGDGELVDIPANAFASILLALGDGLLLHGSLEPGAFRWANISKALDVQLDGISR